MAVVTYNVDPTRLGRIVTMGEPRPHNDQTGRQRRDDAGMPGWQVDALLADLDLEAPIRFHAATCPTWQLGAELVLSGRTTVSAFAGRVAGARRASVTLRTETVRLGSGGSDDLFGDGADYGLHVDLGEPLTAVAGQRLEPTFRRPGAWSRISVVRGWSSTDGAFAGLDRIAVDVPGRPHGIRPMGGVAFAGLRAVAYLNDDKDRSSLDLIADAVIAVEPVATGRRPKLDVPAEAVEVAS